MTNRASADGKLLATPMPAPRFVHLRMHSEYSVTDGIVRIDEAVARAAADGMPALALTDAGNVFGMVKFYTAARAAGVKPLIGVDCWIQNEADREKPYRALLLCSSRAGYLRLSELLSRAWLKNQHRARAEMAMGWFRQSSTSRRRMRWRGCSPTCRRRSRTRSRSRAAATSKSSSARADCRPFRRPRGFPSIRSWTARRRRACSEGSRSRISRRKT